MAKAQRIERLEARISRDQKELFKEAADARGMSLTQFVVTSLQAAAIETLREQQIFEISRRDQEAFVNALIAPEQVSDRLRAAVERHGYLRER